MCLLGFAPICCLVRLNLRKSILVDGTIGTGTKRAAEDVSSIVFCCNFQCHTPSEETNAAMLSTGSSNAGIVEICTQRAERCGKDD